MPDYETICKSVGQLYLELKFELDSLQKKATETVRNLQEELNRVRAEKAAAEQELSRLKS